MTLAKSLALAALLSCPPCLPAREAPIVGHQRTPAEVEARVESILDKMTLQEKLEYVGGDQGFLIRALPRLGLRALRASDGPLGVRGHGPSTAYAAGIALAASWDPGLSSLVGAEIAKDARARGIDFILGPGVNIYRAPLNGRNFEFFGEDPLLSARVAVGYIRGMQAHGVCAIVKHYITSASEFDRHHADDTIGERALREIYLPPFEAAIKEGHVCGLMDAYDELDGVHMTQNGAMNVALAKQEWGFDGIIMSDWGATYDGLAAAAGGLDLEMPSGKHMSPETLRNAIDHHELSIGTLNDKVRRILRLAVRFGWFERTDADSTIPLLSQEARAVALKSAQESAVLLKNAGGLLPLDARTIKTILVVGPNAYPAVPVGGGSAAVEPFTAVSILGGVLDRIGNTANVYYRRGLPSFSELANATEFVTAATRGTRGLTADTFPNADLSGAPTDSHVEPHVNWDGALPEDITNVDFADALKPRPTANRWTGYYIATQAGRYHLFVQGGGFESRYRLYVDDTLVIDCWHGMKAVLSQITLTLAAGPHKIVLEHFRPVVFGGLRLRLGIAREGTLVDPVARELAAKADAVIVAGGYDREIERETGDRGFELPFGQEELISEIALVNPKTVVVVQSGGGFATGGWLEQVPALLEAWYAGQETGSALAGILFGDTNPSGRLPFTFERNLADNPSLKSYFPDPQTGQVSYADDIFVGYRGFERSGIPPLFPFGYGLSYTIFKYSDLRIARRAARNEWQVSFDVTNIGKRTGMEVAQLYLAGLDAKVPRPPKELRGFEKIALLSGGTQRVTFTLDERAFSYFDPAAKRWRIGSNRFEVLVGRSSQQIDLSGQIQLNAR